MIPTDLIATHLAHRLVGVFLGGHLRLAGWAADGRAVIDWGARTLQREDLAFYFDGTKHMIGRVKATQGGLIAADWQGQASPVLLPKPAKILGRVVAVVAIP